MSQSATTAMVLLAMVCLWIATRPAPAATPRRGDRPGPERPALGGGRHAPPVGPRTINPAAWVPLPPRRRDLRRAVALDLVAPGAEPEVWPPRDGRAWRGRAG